MLPVPENRLLEPEFEIPDPAHARSGPVHAISDSAHLFSDSAHKFSDSANAFPDPANRFPDPARPFSDPANGFPDPARVCSFQIPPRSDPDFQKYLSENKFSKSAHKCAKCENARASPKLAGTSCSNRVGTSGPVVRLHQPQTDKSSLLELVPA